MKRSLVIALLMIAVIFVASQALAATDTNNIQVLANVVASCSITTAAANVDFLAYEPTNPVDDTDGSTSVGFRCVKGTTYWAYVARTNTMTGTVFGEFLNYELYTDVARTAVWDAVLAGPGTVAADNTETTIGIYGTIAALQNVSADSYVESVTVTVEY